MSFALPKLYLARHGDTAWTDSHQHTGRTDLPLNAQGEERARQLGERLRGFSFVRVFTSPLQRASKTCELAGFGAVAEIDSDLIEWDYGRWEGTLTTDILKERPNWELFQDGCPDGESPQDVAARADRFIARVQGLVGDVLAFSSGHIIRMIAARWHDMRRPPDECSSVALPVWACLDSSTTAATNRSSDCGTTLANRGSEAPWSET
jgi:broad specificity phosphatase PhoE